MGRTALISIFSVLCAISSFSQNETRPTNSDNTNWNSLKVNVKLNSRLKLRIEHQLRTKTNFSEFDKAFTQVESKYKLSRPFSFSVGLRYSTNNDNQGAVQELEQHFRYYIDLNHEFDIWRVNIKHRLRYQNELGKLAEHGDYVQHNIRYKMGTAINIKNWKLDPFFYRELFIQSQIGAFNGLVKRRNTVGLTYKLTKSQNLHFVYSRDKETRIWNPKKTHIFKIGYVLSI